MPLQDKAKNDIVFQSTLPTRGSDGRRAMEKILRSEISIHAPHEGERPQAGDMRPRRKNISIHAPHEGERRGLDNIWIRHIHFNPRSPRGGATI